MDWERETSYWIDCKINLPGVVVDENEKFENKGAEVVVVIVVGANGRNKELESASFGGAKLVLNGWKKDWFEVGWAKDIDCGGINPDK